MVCSNPGGSPGNAGFPQECTPIFFSSCRKENGRARSKEKALCVPISAFGLIGGCGTGVLARWEFDSTMTLPDLGLAKTLGPGHSRMHPAPVSACAAPVCWESGGWIWNPPLRPRFRSIPRQRRAKQGAAVAFCRGGFHIRPPPATTKGAAAGRRSWSIRHAPTKAAPTPPTCGGKPSLFHPCPAHPVGDHRGASEAQPQLHRLRADSAQPPTTARGAAAGRRIKSIRQPPTKAAPTLSTCGGKPSLFHPCPAHPVEDYRGASEAQPQLHRLRADSAQPPTTTRGAAAGRRSNSIRQPPTKAAPTPSACGGKPPLFHQCPAHPVGDYRGASEAQPQPHRLGTPPFLPPNGQRPFGGTSVFSLDRARPVSLFREKEKWGVHSAAKRHPRACQAHSRGNVVFPGEQPEKAPHSTATPLSRGTGKVLYSSSPLWASRQRRPE
jgi:hypothetical protein